MRRSLVLQKSPHVPTVIYIAPQAWRVVSLPAFSTACYPTVTKMHLHSLGLLCVLSLVGQDSLTPGNVRGLPRRTQLCLFLSLCGSCVLNRYANHLPSCAFQCCAGVSDATGECLLGKNVDECLPSDTLRYSHYFVSGSHTGSAADAAQRSVELL